MDNDEYDATPRIFAKWNLPLLAAELAAHLGSHWDEPDPIENFLAPYSLSRDDQQWVANTAQDLCDDLDRLRLDF